MGYDKPQFMKDNEANAQYSFLRDYRPIEKLKEPVKIMYDKINDYLKDVLNPIKDKLTNVQSNYSNKLENLVENYKSKNNDLKYQASY